MKVCVDPGHGMSNATPGVFDPGAVDDDSASAKRMSCCAMAWN
jgi:hypothetical protein